MRTYPDKDTDIALQKFKQIFIQILPHECFSFVSIHSCNTGTETLKISKVFLHYEGVHEKESWHVGLMSEKSILSLCYHLERFRKFCPTEEDKSGGRL